MEFRRSWGEEWLSFRNDDGGLISVRASWTDAACPDPFVVVAACRSYFRVADLIRLAELLDGLEYSGRDDRLKSDQKTEAPVKEILPHMSGKFRRI